MTWKVPTVDCSSIDFQAVLNSSKTFLSLSFTHVRRLCIAGLQQGLERLRVHGLPAHVFGVGDR